MVNTLQAGAPQGWEGQFPFRIDTIDDFKKWLDHAIMARDHLLPLTPVGDTALVHRSDGVTLRNAYRIIDKLNINNMPAEPPSRPAAFTFGNETALLKNIRRILVNGQSIGNGKTKRKKTVAYGEADTQILSMLLVHHKYQDGGCGNFVPAKGVDLIRDLGLSKAAASGFFKRKFGGQDRYIGMCSKGGALAQKLKELEGGYSPDRRLAYPEHVASVDSESD